MNVPLPLLVPLSTETVAKVAARGAPVQSTETHEPLIGVTGPYSVGVIVPFSPWLLEIVTESDRAVPATVAEVEVAVWMVGDAARVVSVSWPGTEVAEAEDGDRVRDSPHV